MLAYVPHIGTLHVECMRCVSTSTLESAVGRKYTYCIRVHVLLTHYCTALAAALSERKLNLKGGEEEGQIRENECSPNPNKFKIGHNLSTKTYSSSHTHCI